jgi:hypothetical protein
LSLLQISARMKQERPVFIVGAPRSGSSILYRSLLQHPAFAGRELNLAEADPLAMAYRAHQLSPQRFPGALDYLLDDRDAFERFVAGLGPLRGLHRLLGWVRRARRLRDALPCWRGLGNTLLLRAFFFHAREVRGADRLVEKTPRYARRLALLRAAFPEARFLYIVRHPVDAYGSWRRRAAVDEAAGWAQISPEVFCARYRGDLEAVWRWQKRRAGSLHLLRYEAFAARPAAVFADVCVFLEELPAPSALAGPERSFPSAARIDPDLMRPVADRSKHWRDHLSPDTARRIEDALADLLGPLGYERYTGE